MDKFTWFCIGVLVTAGVVATYMKFHPIDAVWKVIQLQ